MKSLGAAVVIFAGCSFASGTAGSAQGNGSDGGAGSSDGRRPIDVPVHDDGPVGLAFVQGAADYSNPWTDSSKTIAATFPNNVSTGDVIAVYVSFATGSTPTFTDSLGSTFHTVDNVSDGNDSQVSVTAYAVTTAAGSDTVTATLSNGGQCCRVLVVHEISGANPSAPLDAHSARFQSGTGTGSNQVTSSAATTAAAGDYIFAATSDGSNASGQQISSGTGENVRENPVIPGGNPTLSEDLIQTAAGPTTSTFTYATSGNALTAQLAFKR